MPEFSDKSRKKLETCHPRLQRLFNHVKEHHDCTILSGYRTEEEQNALHADGKSKVTYPNSKHNKFPSEAVDVAPWPIPEKWGADDWRERVKFYEFAAVVRYEAKRLNIAIRWGGDWDMDNDYRDQQFDDLVHFELAD